MAIHKKKCACGHLLSVEDIYQAGVKGERNRIIGILEEYIEGDIDICSVQTLIDAIKAN